MAWRVLDIVPGAGGGPGAHRQTPPAAGASGRAFIATIDGRKRVRVLDRHRTDPWDGLSLPALRGQLDDAHAPPPGWVARHARPHPVRSDLLYRCATATSREGPVNPPSGSDGGEHVRTSIVLHYHGRPLAGAAAPPGYVEAEPLGTVEARTAADAKAQAARRWPDVPPRAFRTRTAPQAGRGLLAVALVRDAKQDARADPCRLHSRAPRP